MLGPMRVVAGSTVVPHTGSIAGVAGRVSPAASIRSFTADSPALAATPRDVFSCHIYHTGV